MLNANCFPGPRTALLWYFLRCSWTVFANGAFLLLLALFIKYYSDEQVHFHYFLVPSVAIMAFATATILTGASYTFVWRTPVRTAALVHIELFTVFLVVLWMLALFGLVSLILDPAPLKHYIGAVPAALLTYGVARTANVNNRVGLARLFAIGGIVTLLILVFTSTPMPSPGALIFWRPFWMILGVAATLAVMYWAALGHARHTRHGFAPRMLATTRGDAPPRHHSLSQAAPARQSPFRSLNAAQEWREWRQLAHRFLNAGTLWSSAGGLVFLPLLMIGEPLYSETMFADIFFVVSLFLTMGIFGWQWPNSAPPVPLSEWSYSVVLLRILGIAVAALAVVLWLPRLILLFDPEARTLAILAPEMMLAAAWVGWISVALGPGLLYGLIVITFLHYTHGTVYDSLLAPFGLTWLLLFILFQARAIVRSSHAALPVALAAIVVSGAGMCVLPTLALPPPHPILLREILGATLVLGLLYPLVSMQVIPAGIGRAVGVLLAVGVLAIALVTFTLGPISAPGPGILSTYMEFGVLAPLFLPIVILPFQLRIRKMVEDRWR